MSYFTFDKINFEGPMSKNPLAYKYYNAEEVVNGKTMKDHLRFSLAYWHTLVGNGGDPFGDATVAREWNANEDALVNAKHKVYAAFELMEKLGMEYFCFHDKDLVDEQETLEKTQAYLDEVTNVIKAEMDRTGIKCLWATTNAFSNPRFAHGAATSCHVEVFAYAGAQVKKAIDLAKKLNAEGYVFWGGREGYETLLNTDMKFELENLATLLRMAVNYAEKIGFTGQMYIEPKPKEPTKHQYDFDAATVIGFLLKHGLDKHFKLNIETNHATLAMHTVQHELRIAADNDMLGSVDANQGDLLLGWDTDQFPTNIYDSTLMMYEILRSGGLKTGGLNFDAKVRRGSTSVDDLAISHIVGMDTFAKGLKVANAMLEDGYFEEVLTNRYGSWNSEIGVKIRNLEVGLEDLENYTKTNGEAPTSSSRQELLEGILNQFIFETR